MRLKRLTLWALILLLTLSVVFLAATILLLFFFPWETYEGPIQEYLNKELPVRVTFSKPSISWARGLGISVEHVSMVGKGDSVPESLKVSAEKITLRPSLPSLLNREINASLRFESPVVHLEQSAKTGEGSQKDEKKSPKEKGEDTEPETPFKPESLPELLPLPGGFSLTEVRISIEKGSFLTNRPGDEGGSALQAVSNLKASLKVEDDFSFFCKISDSRAAWKQKDAHRPWELAGAVTGEASGRILLKKIFEEKTSPAGSGPGEKNPQTSGSGEVRDRPLPEIPLLPEYIPMPEWLSLTEAAVSIQEGSFFLTPAENDAHSNSTGISEIKASARLQDDRTFQFHLSHSRIRGSRDGASQWDLAGQVACKINLRTLDPETIQANGNLKAEGLNVKAGEHKLNVPESLDLSFDVEKAAIRGVTVSDLLLKGPGVSIRTRGSAKWDKALEEIDLQDIKAEMEQWEVLRTLLPPETEIAGKLSVIAQSLTLKPAGGLIPSTQEKSFRVVLPKGMEMEGAQVRITDGRLHLATVHGLSADVEGLQASLDQGQGRDWTGKVETAMLELQHKPEASTPAARTQGEVTDPKRPDVDLQSAGSVQEEKGGGVIPGETATVTSGTLENAGEIKPQEGTLASGQDQALHDPAGQNPSKENMTAGTSEEKTKQEPSEEVSLGEELPQGKPEAAVKGKEDDTDKASLQYKGPISIQWKLTETKEDSAAILVADLTKGLFRFKKFLDKPAGVPLQMGFRARVKPREIDVGKAYLLLGEMELGAAGTLNNPSDPFLEARLVSNILSLNALAELSPFARKHEMKGLVEIKNLELKGRLESLRETAVLKIRLAGKDLDYNNTPIKGIYAQALYENQNLTLNPLIIHPGQGVMEATFSADFSTAHRTAGRHQYYGTLKINNVELDKLILLASPEYAGKAFGKINVNLACRGTGFSLKDIKQKLEARANVSLSNVTLAEEAEPGKDKGESLARKTDNMVNNLAGGKAAGVETADLDTEEKRLLSNNNASGLLSLRNGTLSTRNLVATYEGKFIELEGDMELSGALNYKGRIFFGNRNVPFRGNCRMGKDSCMPIPDVKAMTVSAAKEVFKGLGTLSSGAKNVFQDIFF